MKVTLPWLGLTIAWVAAWVTVSRASTPAWVTLRDCHYLPNPANDGDSFHVRTRDREYIFRLYFVDAPETDNTVPARLTEQAAYFGVSQSQALQIGWEADKFVRDKLKQPFVVRTCLQNARGRSRLPRYFALVQVDDADLAELLVANGLARVFGAAPEAPAMRTAKTEWHQLRRLERAAKIQRLGGWGINSGRLKERANGQPVITNQYFDAFFHPEIPDSRGKEKGSVRSARTKLDLNRASPEELQRVPGIGRVLAERIIAARPFKNADELQKVKGIKAHKYQQLRPYFE